MTASAPKPVVLCILDGWGLDDGSAANAPELADTPNFDRIWNECPHTTLRACGNAVGLPEGQMGNSEVGHTNIGAGRIVWMDLPKIDKAIEDGSFGDNAALGELAEKLKHTGGTAHIAGLLGPGGVHAHSRHMVAAAQTLAQVGVKVRLHLFTDGRDTPPSSAMGYLESLNAELTPMQASGADIAIATISGRFYAMDRDNRWERVGLAFAAMTSAKGAHATSAAEAIANAAKAGETDEFITPTSIGDYNGMKDGDGLLFTNFRADRAREILSALAAPNFDAFDTGTRPQFAAVCGMVSYSSAHDAFMSVMFPADVIANTLGEWVSKQGKTQLRLAETEKYPHVTFFLNGGAEEPSTGESRHMAPSPKVRTYDLKPEMAAAEVTDILVKAINEQAHDLIVVNYANPDMVGHTGDLEAAKKACEAVDAGLGVALGALTAQGGTMLVTADHGNCEIMVDPVSGEAHTAHTLNLVPLVLVGGPANSKLASGGVLGDLAPTLLSLMQLPQPTEMSGKSLICQD